MYKIENIFTTEEIVKEGGMFCFDGDVDIEKLADSLESEFGIKFYAKNKGSHVNGMIIAQKTFAECQTTWCGLKNISSEGHTCVLLFLYDQTRSGENVNIKKKAVKKTFYEDLKAFMLGKGLKSTKKE